MSAPHEAVHPADSPSTLPLVPPRPGRPERKKVSDALRAGGVTGEADRIDACGKDAIALGCSHVADKTRLIWRGCDSRLCPTCVKRLRKKRQVPTLGAVDLALRNHPDAQLSHVVLTVPNTPDLTRAQLQDFTKRITRWSRRRRVSDNILGLYRCLEVTYNPDLVDKAGNPIPWHPHAHLLVLLRPVADRQARKYGLRDWGELQRQLVLEWHAVTGCVRGCTKKTDSLLEKTAKGCTRAGSLRVTKIFELARPSPGKREELKKKAREVAKYVTKGIEVYMDRGGDAGLEAVATLARAIAGGLRLGSGLGVFKVLKTKIETEPTVCENGHPMARLGKISELVKYANLGFEEAAVDLARVARDHPHLWPRRERCSPEKSEPPGSQASQAEDCW